MAGYRNLNEELMREQPDHPLAQRWRAQEEQREREREEARRRGEEYRREVEEANAAQAAEERERNAQLAELRQTIAAREAEAQARADEYEEEMAIEARAEQILREREQGTGAATR
jgi:dTMP kinase